jgi:hypothetical protein
LTVIFGPSGATLAARGAWADRWAQPRMKNKAMADRIEIINAILRFFIFSFFPHYVIILQTWIKTASVFSVRPVSEFYSLMFLV